MKRIATLVCIASVALASAAVAQIPQTMSYQGVLTTNTGVIVADGPYDLTFRIYDLSSGGSALWTESHNAVAVSKGTFSVLLGASSNPGPVPLNLPFDRPYWLGITVSPGSEISPRTRLASSPYSLNARSLLLPFAGSASVGDGAVLQVMNTTAEVDPSKKQLAVYGIISNPSASFNSAAIRGENMGSDGFGLYGSQSGNGTGVYGISAGGYGVYGNSNTGTAVLASSTQGKGVEAYTASQTAIYGQCGSLLSTAIAIHGRLHQTGGAAGSIAKMQPAAEATASMRSTTATAGAYPGNAPRASEWKARA